MANLKISELCIECKEIPPMRKARRAYQHCLQCRLDIVHKKIKARAVRKTLTGAEGQLVQYYEGGWRTGYLLKLSQHKASIQPIGSRGAPCPDVVGAFLEDMRLAANSSNTMPTLNDYLKVISDSNRRVPKILWNTVEGFHSPVTPPVLIGTVTAETNHDVTVAGQPPVPFIAYGSESGRFSSSHPNLSNPPRGDRAKHPPMNMEEAARLYKEGKRMSEVTEAVRGNRAAGGAANEIRKYLKEQGIYKEPVK